MFLEYVWKRYLKFFKKLKILHNDPIEKKKILDRMLQLFIAKF